MSVRPDSRHALLVSDDRRWIKAAEEAALRVGFELQLARSPAEAMVMLSGCHDVFRLLLGGDVASSVATSLIEMTCGEAASGVDVLLLGGTHPDVRTVAAPDPALLAVALASSDAT